MSEMTDLSGPGPAEPRSGSRQRPDRSAAAVPAAGKQAAERSDTARPGAERRVSERAVSERAVSERAASERAVSERAASERAVSERPVDRRQQRRWVPIAAGWLIRMVGLADIVLGVTAPDSHLHNRLQRLPVVVPGTVAVLTRTADIIIGLLLLMLSHGLRRRKHRAWQQVMVLLVISALISLTHATYLITRHKEMALGVGIAFVVLALLVAAGSYYRSQFYAVGDPRTRWRALGAFAGLLAADLLIGLGYLAAPAGVSAGYTFGQRLQTALYGLVGASGPVAFGPHDLRGDFFAILTGALGFVTVIVTAYLFLRPAEPQGRLGGNDASQIRSLLDRHGRCDSLGYFALRDDKSVIWSATRKSCIGYRVVSGVMLASGDPIGDKEAWPGAIQAFLDMAARHAWVPAVMGCSEHGAEVWCRHGELTALELGDEVARLVRQADSWRGNPTERGFSMALGRIGGPGDERCVIATATQDGVLKALLHFVPWGSDGLSLD